MRERASRTRLRLFLCVGALVITAVGSRLTKKVLYTGDEPRYLLEALSFASEGVPVITESRYEELRAAHTSDSSPLRYSFRDLQPAANTREAKVPHHPILTSLILAPMTATWSLEIIRLLPFAVGLTGLCFLAATLAKQTNGMFSALACFLPALFGFPALPYQFLALPEIFLFTLNAITFWNLSFGPRQKIAGYTPAIICSCLAPLIHPRGLVLFAATAFYFVNLVRGTSDRRVLRIVGAIFLATLIALVLSKSLFRDWFGPLRDLPDWRPRVVLDMFVHYRHGLLPYAPIWVLAFAGLFAALYTGKPWARPALVFLIFFLIGSAKAIGEAYPARFWVQAVPVLTLCLAGFTEGVIRPAVKAIIYLPLAALSFANSVIFVFDPGVHLAARSGAIPYDILAKILSGFDFSFWLDVPDSSLVRVGAICFCVLVIIVVAVASVTRSIVLDLAACLLLLIGFDAHRVRPVAITTAAETNAVVTRLREEISRRPLRLRFLAPWKPVGPRPDESSRPVIEVVDGRTRWMAPIMSGSVLVHKGAAPANDFSVTLRWTDRDPLPVGPSAPGAEFAVSACKSVFARLW